MAEINPPPWMQAGSYPARNDRLGAISSMLCYPGFAVDEATPLRIRQGVKPSYQNYQLKIRAAATPNMTVIVSAGTAWVDNHDVGGYGAYCLVNDADKVLTIAPAGGAGQYRRDAVVGSVYDQETGGATSEWKLEVIQGTYAASSGAAAVPALPTNCTLLGSVLISPSQTTVTSGDISDQRNYSVAVGGILPVLSSIAPPRLHPGQLIYLTDTDTFRLGQLSGTYRQLREGISAVQTLQSANPPFDQTNVYVDFLSASWAPITVTVPPSGQVRVTIGADLSNSNTSTSTATVAWRATGASSVTASNYNYALSGGQTTRVAASRTRLLDGMTPGASLTITPQWRISSGSSATASLTGGGLIVEPVA